VFKNSKTCSTKSLFLVKMEYLRQDVVLNANRKDDAESVSATKCMFSELKNLKQANRPNLLEKGRVYARESTQKYISLLKKRNQAIWLMLIGE